jgi:hypothetical protein
VSLSRPAAARPRSALRTTFLGCSREDTLVSPSPTVRSANACTESLSGPSRTVPPRCSLSLPKSPPRFSPGCRGPHQSRGPVAASISRGLGRLRRRRQPPIKHRTSTQRPNHVAVAAPPGVGLRLNAVQHPLPGAHSDSSHTRLHHYPALAGLRPSTWPRSTSTRATGIWTWSWKSSGSTCIDPEGCLRG